MEEKKPETKNEDKATADNVRGGEIVLPASMAQTPRESEAMEKIDLTQSIPARAFKLDEAAIQVIRELKCPGATKTEVAWFLYQCHALGLNPLLPGQISFIAYNDKRTGERKHFVMVEIGGHRGLCQRTGRYRQGDPPILEWQEKGPLPEAVTVSLYEKVGNEWVKHARRFLWSEFKLFHGRSMWQDNPAVMFAKAAEAALLRFYFPDALSGIYIPEEMDAPDISEQGEPEKKVSVYEQAHGLLATAQRKFRDLGAAKPKEAAVALAKKTVPGKDGTDAWTQDDVDAFRAAVDKIDQPPTSTPGQGGPEQS